MTGAHADGAGATSAGAGPRATDRDAAAGRDPDSDAAVPSVDAAIRARRTAKLLRDPDAGATPAPLSATERATLDEMIALAGHAPFHRRADASHRDGTLDSIVPWRFHVLERDACHRLLDALRRRADDDDPDPKWTRAASSKIPALVAAAGALVQVTWLPNPPAADAPATGIDDDDVEHVAAASAAVQNLLLAAEARRWYAYWSSGGILRDPDVFALLGIAPAERLLGSIFLAPPGATFDRELGGGLRERRGEPSGWSRRVTLD